MNTEDEDIKAFFADMRSDDMQHAIPKFEDLLPKKKPSGIRYLLPISIAASLIVGFAVWTNTTSGVKTTSEEDVLVITIGDEETITEALLSPETSVFSWESSTTSLINDFND